MSLLKTVLAVLLIHALTCGWIYISCRYKIHYKDFPVEVYEMPPKIESYINYEQWAKWWERKEGCPRTSTGFNVTGLKRFTKSFYVPREWEADYVVALYYIVVLRTHMNLDTVLPLTLKEVFYKIFTCQILYLIELWITSIAISSSYLKLRQLYRYNYQISELIKYLKTNGVCEYLLQIIKNYAKLQWKRHSSSHIPKVLNLMSICLREDVYESLYMYHLMSPKLFSDLPVYFLRQMVIRLKRMLVFPGKYLVQEGDIHPFLYFIHEGEVEKWYTNRHGESCMASVLGTSGYFGLIPGLFPNMPYKFSYYSRTMVDLMYLEYNDWQDLLDGYPDIKKQLYEKAIVLKKQKYKSKSK